MPTPPDPLIAHRIRLRGPWEFTWLDSAAGLTAERRTGTVRLPAAWTEAFGDLLGTVRLSRRFNRPTGLDDAERVWLEVEVPAEISVSLDGAWLGHVASGAVRFDVTGRLGTYGRIDLDMRRETATAEVEPIAEVALVIESPE